MTHREKVARFVHELQERGVGKFSAAPPVFRLLWAAGVEIPPPFFIPFVPLMLFMALFVGVLLGFWMWLIQRWTIRIPTDVVLVAAAAVGVLSGFMMAVYSRRKAKRLRLPSWKDYGEA